ncbi:SecY-interacting protein Syd [Isosphaeraceae bacterium EP7]
MGEVKRILAELMERDVGQRREHDPEWPSPCEYGEIDSEGMTRWRPVEMIPPPDFRDVEEATGVVLSQDIREVFGSYHGWTEKSGFRGMSVSLYTSWNPEEFANFKRKIIQHIRLCPSIPALLSVYFANTDSDPFYSVDLATGEILLEEPDWPRTTVIAPSLAAFLSEL